MPSRRVVLIGLPLAVAAASLVGCGGGEEAEGPAATTTSARAVPSTVAPASSTTLAPAGAGAGAAPAGAIEVTAVSATAPSHAGSCPVDLSVAGTIVASGAGRVTYTFVRNDGFSTPLKTVPVVAGSTPVAATWKLGSPGASNAGWAALEVITPTRIRSERVDFTVACDQAPTRESPSGGGY